MTKPESVGLSSERLARLDRAMTEKYVDTQLLPGFLVQVFRRGELAHTGMSGFIDIERGKKMQEDTIFRIYSMTKPITAVALMMLVEEGKIALDDDVHAYIPSWKNLRVYVSGVPSLTTNTAGQYVTVPPKRRMKVIDLVTHTSGLTYGFMTRTAVDAEYRRQKIGDFQTPGGLDAFIEQLANVPLDFSPGDYWTYSVSIDVMGYLVQKLSGQTFGEFLRSRIFKPLGMRDTAFSVPANKLDRFCSCYMPKKGGGLEVQDDAQKSTYLEPPKLESGGGGLVSTAHDYLRFCRMMLNGGELDGVRILSPKTVELFSLNLLPGGKLMSDMQPAENMFSEAGYAGVGFSIGCGVTMDLAKARVPGSVGEYFWGGAAATAFWIDPKEDLTVVFMTQVMGTEARLSLRRDLRTLVYASVVD
ncbi:MAG TPA: serine hydrolase domain-containing protein [Rhizomicrobium sp.]|jgi:CubicO group peptidase (beta-lactamase class C family)|nr:serine hydrolase domain-containing protein [Rhizomicrobium sp.]